MKSNVCEFLYIIICSHDLERKIVCQARKEVHPRIKIVQSFTVLFPKLLIASTFLFLHLFVFVSIFVLVFIRRGGASLNQDSTIVIALAQQTFVFWLNDERDTFNEGGGKGIFGEISIDQKSCFDLVMV